MEVYCGIETCNCYEAKNSVGQLIYNIKENSGFCTRCCCGPRRCLEIDVLDFTNTAVIHIVRPLRCVHCCWFCCLQVRTTNGVAIGAVTKEWGGLVKEYFTDTDTFNVSFPLDLDVNMKAALMAAALLIDYMFFERAYAGKEDRVPGMAG
ncbi:phospholipid scramblase 2-like isoform X3 [Dermacentor andersoni]|uniref:phospholipid scramblase 2-like isoform X3 n=1 Tax=Dermacentor andersoni TaxID=34620 RepID=UPI0024180105|nr:phospholipid scramblase 2-like isoform X3 [Dermacentor andersoni]